MAKKKKDDDSMLTNLLEAYAVLKGVKGIVKFGVGPLALGAVGYYLYQRIKGRSLTA